MWPCVLKRRLHPSDPEEPPENASTKSPAPRAGSPAPGAGSPALCLLETRGGQEGRKEGNPGPSRHNTVLIRPPHTHTHLNVPQKVWVTSVRRTTLMFQMCWSHWLMVILGEQREQTGCLKGVGSVLLVPVQVSHPTAEKKLPQKKVNISCSN